MLVVFPTLIVLNTGTSCLKVCKLWIEEVSILFYAMYERHYWLQEYTQPSPIKGSRKMHWLKGKLACQLVWLFTSVEAMHELRLDILNYNITPQPQDWSEIFTVRLYINEMSLPDGSSDNCRSKLLLFCKHVIHISNQEQVEWVHHIIMSFRDAYIFQVHVRIRIYN